MGYFNIVAEANKYFEKAIEREHKRAREEMAKYEKENGPDLFETLSDALNPMHAQNIEKKEGITQ